MSVRATLYEPDDADEEVVAEEMSGNTHEITLRMKIKTIPCVVVRA